MHGNCVDNTELLPLGINESRNFKFKVMVMVDSVTVANESALATQVETSPIAENPVLSDTLIVPQNTENTAGLTTELGQLPSMLERAQSILEIGGPVVFIMLLMAFVALTIVTVKLLQFARLRIGNTVPANKAIAALRNGDISTALLLVENRRNPVAQVMVQALNGRQSNLPEAKVREEVLRFGTDILFQLRRGFRPLEVIGSTAPLLGLLGTVMGMITAFQQLEAAGNQVNPAILSGGIWEALLTTAVGLCVAIPVVALLNWLERRVDHLAHDMDNLVTQVFTADLLALRPANAASVTVVEKTFDGFADAAKVRENALQTA